MNTLAPAAAVAAWTAHVTDLAGDGADITTQGNPEILAALADGTYVATRSMFGPLIWRASDGAAITPELDGTLTADTGYTMQVAGHAD